MKKILCNGQAEINCYPEYGFLFSILNDIYDPWVMNHFIQIQMIPGWEYFLSFQKHSELLEDCPYIERRVMERNELEEQGDVAEFVEKQIQKNNCLFLFLDRFYIKGVSEYQRYHYMHNSFVVGFDSEQSIIFLADNFENGKFSMLECTYEDFRKAFCYEDRYHVKHSVLQREYAEDIVKYIEDLIDQNGKAFVFAERHEISELKTPFSMAHEVEIIGYDKIQNLFFIKDRSVRPDGTVKCSYDELRNAYRRDPKEEQNENIWIIHKKNDEKREIIDIRKIKTEIEAFLEPPEKKMIGGYAHYFGTEALNVLAEGIRENKTIRFRVWHFLYEYETIMERRIHKLFELGLLNTDEILIEELEKLKISFRKLRNIAVKNSLVNYGIDEYYVNYAADTIEKEKRYMEYLYQRMKTAF